MGGCVSRAAISLETHSIRAPTEEEIPEYIHPVNGGGGRRRSITGSGSRMSVIGGLFFG